MRTCNLLFLLPMLLLAQEPAGLETQQNNVQPEGRKAQIADVGQEGVAMETPKTVVSQACQELLMQAKKENPSLDADAMILFYRKNSPDLLAEWESRCVSSLEKGADYMKLLIKNFLDIDKYREGNPDEYERLVRLMQNESLIRTTSLEIQNLAKHDTPEDKEKLLELKLKLRKLMEDAFDEAQRRQLLEINRLENEVRNLRNLAEQRAANKQSILQQRFILLTNGQEWPK